MRTALTLSLLGSIIALTTAACSESAVKSDPAYHVHPQEVHGLPILWLGESYDSDGDGVGDMQLRSGKENISPEIRHPRTGEVIVPQRRSYSFSYGECEIPEGQRSCRLPITIVIEDPCASLPLAEEVLRQRIDVRGVSGVVYGEGSIRIEMGEATIQVHGPPGDTPEETLSNTVRVVEHLKGANDEASHITPNAPFSPPPAPLRHCE